jgi:hypothetical protein
MQHSGAADGPVSATVSQIHAGCKQTSSSVAAVDETAGAGAEQRPCRRRRRYRGLLLPDRGSDDDRAGSAYTRRHECRSGHRRRRPSRISPIPGICVTPCRWRKRRKRSEDRGEALAGPHHASKHKRSSVGGVAEMLAVGALRARRASSLSDARVPAVGREQGSCDAAPSDLLLAKSAHRRRRLLRSERRRPHVLGGWIRP